MLGERIGTYYNVSGEDNAAAHIPDLTDYELTTWQLDQRINVRGVQVDTPALDAMLDILGQIPLGRLLQSRDEAAHVAACLPICELCRRLSCCNRICSLQDIYT